MPKPEPITERAFITGLAKIIECEAWPHVADWYRTRAAARMLDAKNAEERESIAVEHRSALDLIRAIENEVTSKRSLIDGRTTRHTASKSPPRSRAGSTRSASPAAYVAGNRRSGGEHTAPA